MGKAIKNKTWKNICGHFRQDTAQDKEKSGSGRLLTARRPQRP